MRKFLVLTVTAALVVLMGSSAQATIRDITDPPGDVVRVTEDESGLQFEPVSGAEGDVVFTRIQHTATAVVAYVRFRQLTVPKQYAVFTFAIAGNNGWGLEADILTRHGDPQGELQTAGQQYPCAHRYRINYAGDSVWVRFARGCLKNPKYIRVSVDSLHYRISPAGAFTEYYDVAMRDGFNSFGQLYETWTPWVVTG